MNSGHLQREAVSALQGDGQAMQSRKSDSYGKAERSQMPSGGPKALAAAADLDALSNTRDMAGG